MRNVLSKYKPCYSMQNFQLLQKQSKKIHMILVLGMFPFEIHVFQGVGTITSKRTVV